ncbi:MAG TPA: retropepsin-like aspartic protease [Candidatus Binatia bacterium]|nr:retropepsin-like aspartic protease [Candidatus Binatia bacterium]
MPRSWASFRPFSLPVIAVRVGGTIVRALVDTGAGQSLIDPRLVKQLGLQLQGTVWIVGVGTKPLSVPLISIEDAAIGRFRLSSFQAEVMDLANLGIGIQLILGIDSFRGYRLQFDLAKGKLYLLS